MKRFLSLSASLALVALVGCTRDDTAVKEKLDSIDQRLAAIETAVKSGGGRGAAAGAAGDRGPQRPRPNPTDVYAIPVAGAPIEGNPEAKVTIIDAFEFA